jgi:hypothetical protein
MTDRNPDTGVPAEYVERFFGACHGGDLIEYFPECGATCWRNGTNWSDQEPEPGEYDFSELDTIASSAAEHDVDLLPILGFTAPWASSAPDDADNRNRYPPRDEMTERWQQYIKRLIERYPDIDNYEVWNEPNISFFQGDYKDYIDYILEPAAEVLHAHDKKVVAPSYTVEHPDRGGDREEFSERSHWNNEINIDAMDRWLQYNDAWRFIDYLSVHYTKGDTKKPMLPAADNMMSYYDYIYENYIEPGKLDGMWNTEEGLTATQVQSGEFVALEPWEREPYSQWVPRYTIPVLYWALQHEWTERDDYKLFWYHMDYEPDKYGTLQATNLLRETDSGELEPSALGTALRTLTETLTSAEFVDVYSSSVDVGFELFDDTDQSGYQFTNYAFELDDRIFVAAWLDLPGIELTKPERTKIQACIQGLSTDSDVTVSTVDYETGAIDSVDDYEWSSAGHLHVRLPRIANPVLYFTVDT